MGSHAQSGGVGEVSVTDATPAKADRSKAWGPLSAFGLFVAVVSCLLDQATKLWLLYGLHLSSHSPIALTPFAELVLTWNPGISFGLLPQDGPIGPWALLGVKIAAVIFLWIWLARTTSRLTALALGLIIGGAVGNAVDRLLHYVDPVHWPGGVMDFVLLHLEIAGFSLRWYVFNLADVAIVAGVVALLCESLRQGGAVKAP
jgi:signal peptidase II